MEDGKEGGGKTRLVALVVIILFGLAAIAYGVVAADDDPESEPPDVPTSAPGAGVVD